MALALSSGKWYFTRSRQKVVKIVGVGISGAYVDVDGNKYKQNGEIMAPVTSPGVRNKDLVEEADPPPAPLISLGTFIANLAAGVRVRTKVPPELTTVVEWVVKVDGAVKSLDTITDAVSPTVAGPVLPAAILKAIKLPNVSTATPVPAAKYRKTMTDTDKSGKTFTLEVDTTDLVVAPPNDGGTWTKIPGSDGTVIISN